MAKPCDTGMCNGSDCIDCFSAPASEANLPQIDTCSEKEQLAYIRGMIEMAPVVSPFFSLTDLHERTNNTFIQRYLENRTLRIPKE